MSTKKKIKLLSDLKFDNKNINKGTEYGNSLLLKSLQNVGAGRSVLADKNGVLIAGNKTIEAAAAIGMDKIRVVETNGDEIVVVQRMDIDINDKKGVEMKILDNTISKHNYLEDVEVADAICESLELDDYVVTSMFSSNDNAFVPGDLNNNDVQNRDKDKSKLSDRADSYTNNSVRQIVLLFDIETHKKVYDFLQSVAQKYGIDDNSQAMIKIMETYEL